MPLAHLAALFVVLVCPLAAQQNPRPVPPQGGSVRGAGTELTIEQVEARKRSAPQGGGAPQKQFAPAPAQSLSDNTRLRSMMATIMSTEPRRLTPGGRGQIHLVLSLRRDAVLKPGDHFELSYPKAQAGLRLGAWVCEPPSGPSTLAPAFLGQVVYDNTIRVSIPVNVDQNAQHGRFDVEMQLQCDVYNGESGSSVGRLAMPIERKVVIGDPVPKPKIRSRGAARASSSQRPQIADPGSQVATGEDSRTPRGDGLVAGDPLPEGEVGVLGPEAQAEVTVPASMEIPPDNAGGGGLMWLAGAAGALALVLLAAFVLRSGSR